MADTEEKPSPFSSKLKKLTDFRAHKAALQHLVRNLIRFFRLAWRDIVVLIVLGAITAGVWFIDAALRRRVFPTWYWNSIDVDLSPFAYPYRRPYLSNLVVALVCILVPLFAILLAQIWVRSFDNAASAILGLAYALVLGTHMQVILTKTIGGFRPHFLTVCQPGLPPGTESPTSVYGDTMFSASQVCQGKPTEILNGMESFPSGHVEVAFAGLGFLAIYLFAHLGIRAHERRGLWRMVLVLEPIVLATAMAGGVLWTYNHFWYDVLMGALIGFGMAFFAYRMVFQSIRDDSTNSVPRYHSSAGQEKGDGAANDNTADELEGQNSGLPH